METTALITIESISKRFGKNRLFRDVTMTLGTGSSLAITGPNGAGKSTLLKIMLGLITPDRGTVRHQLNGNPASLENVLKATGYLGPELHHYPMLTGWENSLSSCPEKDYPYLESLFGIYDLYSHRNKRVEHYSTGMKQRLKIICALAKRPSILLLDEPGSNLDSSGKELLYHMIPEQSENMLIVIATNDPGEAHLCHQELTLG